MKNKSGRKSYFEELNIADRYSKLSEPYFRFLKKMMDSDDKADQKWAAERLEKAFVKMIPQDITSDGKQLPQPIINVYPNDSHEEDTSTKKEN